MYIVSHSKVSVCPIFYLKAYLCCTKPFRKKLYGLLETSLFLGNDKQHMSVCAEMIKMLLLG